MFSRLQVSSVLIFCWVLNRRDNDLNPGVVATPYNPPYTLALIFHSMPVLIILDLYTL